MRNRLLSAAAFSLLLVPLQGVESQLLSQSDLTLDDVDPGWEMTLDHLAMDTRWMGLPPRELTWSPDGEWLYFRWREDPEPGQRGDTDPWYAVDREGSEMRTLTDDEAARIPRDPVWSADRSRAAWSHEGTLFVWDREGGLRTPVTLDGSLGNVHLSADGDRVFFSTSGTSWFFEGGGEGSMGDLWVWNAVDARLRQVARGVRSESGDTTEAGKWLARQQEELMGTIMQRRRDREVADSMDRVRSPAHVQRIPVESGVTVRNLRLSPDGRRVTFQWVQEPSGEHRTSYMQFVNESGYAERQRARPKVGEPMATFRMGIVRVDPTVEPDSVEIRWVDDGLEERETIIHGPWYSPDGEHAVLQILSMDHKDRWISLLDLETGETTVVDHQHEDAWIGGPLVEGRWSPGYLRWLPDGSGFAFGSTATGWAMLYLAEEDDDGTFRTRQLTRGEWEVREAELGPEGEWWYLTTSREHPGEEHLYRLPAHGGDLERLTPGEGKYASTVSPDGHRVATLFETNRLMPDLYLMDPEPDADLRWITKSGTDAFYRMDLLDSEIVTFDDYAGNPTWAEIWETPESPNGAAVVYVHGCGECAQAVTKGWDRVGAKLYAKYLAQKGYQSANLDYRGSSGYGHENRTYAYRQMGVSDIDSGLALLDLLEGDYGVDPDRIGVYGGSYGGFYTLMAIFRHPDRFRAGVALYPVTDWAHYNHGYTSRILNGAPYEDPEAYRRSSPVYYVDGYRRGLQIQHGLVDGNVQTQDSFRLMQMLMEHEKPFDAMIYPTQDHGWDETPSRRDSYWRMTRWFDQELLGKAAVTGGTATETEGAGR